jgi:hypothetical protein
VPTIYVDVFVLIDLKFTLCTLAESNVAVGGRHIEALFGIIELLRDSYLIVCTSVKLQKNRKKKKRNLFYLLSSPRATLFCFRELFFFFFFFFFFFSPQKEATVVGQLGVHRVKRVDTFEVIPLSFMPNVASPEAARDEQVYLTLLNQALNERTIDHSVIICIHRYLRCC